MSEPARRRRLLILAAKLAIGAALIAWLVSSGTLDFSKLSLFFERPELLLANLAVFAATTVFGALRWRLLLRAVDVRLSLGRALQLAFTAVFFNVVVPGNIGGDVIKSIYVARAVPAERRAGVYLIALVDRLLALVGLVMVAGVLTIASGHTVWQDPRLRDLGTAVVVLMIVTLVAPLVALVLIRRFDARLERWSNGTTRLRQLLGRIVSAARLISEKPRALVVALLLAIATHLLGILLFAALATAVTGQHVSVLSMASVYPLGMLSVVLPISYAGFGVGHVAFDQLFAIVGLSGGANVLNVYLIGQTAPCLFGVLPYLTLRREAAPSEAELVGRVE